MCQGKICVHITLYLLPPRNMKPFIFAYDYLWSQCRAPYWSFLNVCPIHRRELSHWSSLHIDNRHRIDTCTSSPDSKVHGANMGPIWVLSAPDGPHVGLMNFAIWVIIPTTLASYKRRCKLFYGKWHPYISILLFQSVLLCICNRSYNSESDKNNTQKQCHVICAWRRLFIIKSKHRGLFP